jgi:hypothetical protein
MERRRCSLLQSTQPIAPPLSMRSSTGRRRRKIAGLQLRQARSCLGREQARDRFAHLEPPYPDGRCGDSAVARSTVKLRHGTAGAADPEVVAAPRPLRLIAPSTDRTGAVRVRERRERPPRLVGAQLGISGRAGSGRAPVSSAHTRTRLGRTSSARRPRGREAPASPSPRG